MSGNAMQAGDIVFFKSDGSIWDLLIKTVSPDYTHVGVAISPFTLIEAQSGGIRFRELEELKNHTVHIYRVKGLKNRFSAFDTPRFFDFRKYLFDTYIVGSKYSYTQAFSAGILRVLKLRSLADTIDKNWFCSEFTAYLIHTYFGVRLCSHLPFQDILPTDIAKDDRVAYKYSLGTPG